MFIQHLPQISKAPSERSVAEEITTFPLFWISGRGGQAEKTFLHRLAYLLLSKFSRDPVATAPGSALVDPLRPRFGLGVSSLKPKVSRVRLFHRS